MRRHTLIKEETKATSQHQITIPKKIWDTLGLHIGLRFQFVLNDKNEMIVTPKWDDLDLSPREWKKLFKLAQDESNVSRRFKSTKEAKRYLDKL